MWDPSPEPFRCWCSGCSQTAASIPREDPVSHGTSLPVAAWTVLNQERWWFPWSKPPSNQGAGSYLHFLCSTQDIAAPAEGSVQTCTILLIIISKCSSLTISNLIAHGNWFPLRPVGHREAHALWTLYRAWELKTATAELGSALFYPSLTGHPGSHVSVCPKQQMQVNLDVSNSCISSVTWEVALTITLHEIISFLQLMLWGCVFSREKANIDSANCLALGGVARLGDKWSRTGGFMHLCINVIAIVWLEKIIFCASGLV